MLRGLIGSTGGFIKVFVGLSGILGLRVRDYNRVWGCRLSALTGLGLVKVQALVEMRA